WRDGMLAQTIGYAPGGLLETSAIQTIAPRLVHLHHPSARRHGAEEAKAATGEQLIASIAQALRNRLEGAWAQQAVTDDH
ncbi:MAG: hypothetical protein OWT27_07650, partial [Firmicutes bacterium]|nr:hypothetical protein [Bacillota bacterium]